MTSTDTLLVTIAASIFVWVVTRTAIYCAVRSRSNAGIVIDIIQHSEVVSDSKAFVEKMFKNGISVGKPVIQSAQYWNSDLRYYQSVISSLPIYFTKNELVKIIKFYRNLQEFDELMEGILSYTMDAKSKGRVIEEREFNVLSRKKERIIKLAELLDNKGLKTVDDLRVDYSGKIAPETIVMP